MSENERKNLVSIIASLELQGNTINTPSTPSIIIHNDYFIFIHANSTTLR